MDKHIDELSKADIDRVLNAAEIHYKKGSVVAGIVVRLISMLEATNERAKNAELELLAKLEAAEFEIKELRNKLDNPIPLPKAAYFHNSAENLPFFRAFSVIEAIHTAGFKTVTYED